MNSEAFNSVINIGFTLDPGYILQTMLTISSIMATQNKLTKIVFHFGVKKILMRYICLKCIN